MSVPPPDGWTMARAGFAIFGGAALSFLALGVLWIGTAWQYQALMFVPFFLLSFTLTKTGEPRVNPLPFIACGAAPLGLLLMMFRDNKGSHLMPVLIVCAWAAGAAAGYYAKRRTERN